jgi:hypothetical protein
LQLVEEMRSKLQIDLEKNDLAAQFQHFRRLWGCFQQDKESTTLHTVCTSPEHFTFFLCL